MPLDVASDSGVAPGAPEDTSPGPRVTAIVPVFNEEDTLAEVLIALRDNPLVDDALVVSDGSTDRSLEIAATLGVRSIALPENRGKARAMAVGVAATEAPILLFLDGDILNLSEYLIERLVEPVLTGETAMNVGVRSRPLLNAVQKRLGPRLSGLRCLRREIFEAVPECCLAGYRIEVGLNWACRRLGLPTTSTVLYRLRHRVKEKKQGLSDGLRARCRMFWVVFKVWLGLKLRPPSLGHRPPADPAA